MVKYSIVIPTYNHLDDCLKPCLESIIKCTDLDNIEIIVVANGCTDGTKQYVESFNKSVKLLWYDEPLGYTKSTNEGIKASQGEFVILLNNDCVLLGNQKNKWINDLYQPFVDDEKIMATGVHEVYNEKIESWFIVGYCLMVKKWFFENYGLLDEIFSPGCGEDTDLCLRIVENGYKFTSLDKHMLGTFPIFHKGESTFHESNEMMEKYQKIIKRNDLVLENRYSNRKLKLNIGAGNLHLDGYLSLDLYNETADIKSDIVNIPFKENSIEEIVSFHVLEHVLPTQVEKAIKEWYKLLMPGGKLVIEMPNILAICEDFPKVGYGEKFNLLYYMYCNPQLLGHAHLYGWWPESIYNLLYHFGFREITFKQPQTHLDAERYCMRVEAIAEKKQEKPEKKSCVFYTVWNNDDEYYKNSDTTLKDRYDEIIEISTNSLIRNCSEDVKVKVFTDHIIKNLDDRVEQVLYEYPKYNFERTYDRNLLYLNERYKIANQLLEDFDNILFLDSDTVVVDNMDEMLLELSNHDKILVSEENGSILDSFFAGFLMTEEEKVKYYNLKGFSAGVWFSNKSNKDVFLDLYNYILQNYKRIDSFFGDQPFFDYYLLSNDLYDNTLNTRVNHYGAYIDENGSIISDSNEIIDGCTDLINKKYSIVHFSYGVNPSKHKLKFMKNLYKSKYGFSRDEFIKSLDKGLVIAEVGVFKGDFSKIIESENDPKELHLIDIFEGVEMSGDKDGKNVVYANLNEEYEKLKLYFKDKNVKLHKGYSNQVLNSFPDNYFDVIYIDASHDYENIKIDLGISFEKTKVGGLICGHDYTVQHFPDVVRAVDEFCQDKNLKIEFISNDDCPTYSIRKTHDETIEKSQIIKNNMDKKVNVIIPTYKRYNLLREALDSVLKQTYKNINVIVVADGADEFTKKIVTEYDWKDDKIRFNYYDIPHEGNLGSAPRIYGIDQLDEEGFVCFLDDDNMMNPDYVEKMVKGIDDTGKDISICRIYLTDRNESIPLDENNIKHGWIDSLNILVPNKIVKLCKDKWNQVGEKVNHDFNFITECLKHGRIRFVPLTLGTHRYTESGYIENEMKPMNDYKTLFEKLEKNLKWLYEEIFVINSYNYTEGELNGEILVDIGANVGYFSIFAAYHGAKTIYAFEPNKDNFKKLVEWTKDFPNIIPINKAVHRPDVKKCYTIMDDVVCQVRNDGQEENSIDCVSLEEIANRIGSDFVLKIDCEGGEYDILLPCTEDVLKKIKIVYGEFHNNMHPNKEFNTEIIKDFFIKNNYKLDVRDDGLKFASGYWYDDGTFVPFDVEGQNESWKFIRKNSLQDLGIKYSTDKATVHKFCDFYDEHLMKIKDEKINLLEIGIYLGQSLLMWKEYFKNGMIYAIDVFDKSHLDDDRIKTSICDQTDINKITDLYRNIDFNLIIDDGSHLIKHQIASFGNLFKKLNGGGIYILEDLHTSNVPAYRDFMGYETSTLYLLEEFQKTGKFNSEFLTDEENLYLSKNIESVEIFKNNNGESITSVIKKKENKAHMETISEQFKKEDSFIHKEIFELNAYLCSDEELHDATVLDLGANIGMFSVYASQHGAKKIYAYEPNKINFDKLIEFTKGFPNITCINKAVCRPGIKRVFSEGEKGTSIVKEGDTENSVDCIALEEILDEVNDENLILKIDVEGSEYDILLNCPAEKLKRFKVMYTEFHDTENKQKEQLNSYIEKLGYQRIPSSVVTINYVKDENGNDTTSIDENVSTAKFIKKNEVDVVRKLESNENHNISKPENMKRMTVTATVSTKNRYFSTLPMCLSAIATQTVKPNKLIIFDDGEHLDLRNDPTYINLFTLFDKNRIEWEVVFGEGKGQVKNHQTAIDIAKTEFIWRLDDDNVPESNVLETLLHYASDDKVGAVAGLVLDPKSDIKPNKFASNKIDDIFSGLNEQWFLPSKDYETKSVDHLYSSFLFRVKAAKHGYCPELSMVGHREETIFTYEMKLEGWEILITPKCITWHLRNPVGGIRDDTREDMWAHDEEIFKRKLRNWKLNIKEPKYIVLDNGIGDHYAFKSVLPKIKEKYKDLILAVCYPEVFEDEGIPLISIADALQKFNDISKWSIYAFMGNRNWKKHITEAYLEMYL